MKASLPKGRIVSVTPMAVRTDSRTYKQASSFRRFGMNSVVVEAIRSNLDPATLPFDLVSIPADAKPAVVPASSDRVGPVSPERATSEPALSEAAVFKRVERTLAELPSSGLLEKESIPSNGKSGYLLVRGATVKTLDLIPGGFYVRRPLIRIHNFIYHLVHRVGRAGWRSVHVTSVVWARCKTLAYKNVLQVSPRALKGYLGLWSPSFVGKWRILIAEWRISEQMQYKRYLQNYFKLYLWSTYRALPPAKLYYLHAFYQFPAVYLRCWRHRARYIYDAHDFYAQLDDEESLSSFWRHWILPFERRMELACVNRAAAVVTVNGGIADLIKNRFGCDVLVLRNSHDRRLDLPVQQTIRDVIGLGKRDFLIVSIGNWKPGMAMEEAFLALEALPPRVHLAFLGGGYPDYQARLATGGLAERVHILDPVDPACVVPFIKTADAGIILYYAKSIDYHHSLPNRFFQSVAGGLPLLYPMLNEIARLCEQHDLGIAIDPQEPQSIVSAIQKLIDSPQTAASLKRNAANAMDELSWERDEKVLQELVMQHWNRRSKFD